jgi:hypothetical protein
MGASHLEVSPVISWQNIGVDGGAKVQMLGRVGYRNNFPVVGVVTVEPGYPRETSERFGPRTSLPGTLTMDSTRIAASSALLSQLLGAEERKS